MAFFLTVCLSSLYVAASTEAVIRSESVVRREVTRPEVRMHLGASGGIVLENGAYEEPPCNEDYVMGTPSMNNCTADYHELVTNRAKCLAAATAHGVHTMAEPEFTIKDSLEYRPEGCFKVPCSHHGGDHAPAGDCYFFNPIGYQPPHAVTGTPVCMRPRVTLGTNDSSTCRDDYELIMDDTDCKEAAACLMYDVGPDFRANEKNNSMYDDFPKGCFIRKFQVDGADDGRVFLNEPIKDWPRDKPAHPQGIPMCLAKNRITATKAATSDDTKADTSDDTAATTTTTTTAAATTTTTAA